MLKNKHFNEKQNYKSLNKIKKAKSVCLIAHTTPDVDAIASMVVLRELIIKKFHKPVDIFAECQELDENCLPILGDVTLNKTPQNYDCAMIVDCPNVERLGKYAGLYNAAQIKGVIDHHATNNLKADITIVEVVSSTCEILYSILKASKIKLNKHICSRLYAGLVTDTNNFSVGALTKRSFELAGACLDFVQPSLIYEQFFQNSSLQDKKILSTAIANATLHENGRILISHISRQESQKLHLNENSYTGISNQLATTKPCKLVCFVHPKGDSYYVSMRAKQPYDVAHIAKENGGGGHVGAAAYLSSASLQEIEQKALKELTKEFNSKKEREETSIF